MEMMNRKTMVVSKNNFNNSTHSTSPVSVENFNQPEEFQLKKSKQLTTLSTVGKQFYVSFKLQVTKHTPGVWRNILHLTKSGNAGHGQRIPAVWLYQDNTLLIVSSVNGMVGYGVTPKKHPLKEGKWYWIEIQQMLKEGKVQQDSITNFIISFILHFSTITK